MLTLYPSSSPERQGGAWVYNLLSCNQTSVNEHPLLLIYTSLNFFPLPPFLFFLLSTEIYLKHASEDLAVFARHAGRRTVEVDDVILLLRRQRHISESQGFEYLVNTYLPLEYIEELLPCAVAGKRIVPSMKS